MTWVRRLLLAGLVVLLIFQVIPAEKIDSSFAFPGNPEVEADINAPDEVKAILRRACYDCHSNETKWPWYTGIAPGSWLMYRDVNVGRGQLNFSEWGDFYDEEDTPEMFADDPWRTIESGEMPPWFYVPLHPEARLTAEDLAILKKWAGIEAEDDDSAADEDEEMDEASPDSGDTPAEATETDPEAASPSDATPAAEPTADENT